MTCLDWRDDNAHEVPGQPRVGVDGRIPGARFWRAVSWAGGLLLIAYGGTNTIVSGAVLAGLIRPDGGYDPAAITGHALLWDPLFFTWGAALVLSLWFSRPRVRP